MPQGINAASIGVRAFLYALAVAAAWSGLSVVLAWPWAAELGALIGQPLAWAMIAGIGIAPGFMNAFQTASLLMRPQGVHPAPREYPPLTVLIAAYNEVAGIADTLRSIEAQRYPGELDVIVIDDGSADGTARVVEGTPHAWLRLLRQVEEYLSGQPQTAAVAGAVFVQNGRASWITRLQYWDYFHGIAATKRAQAAYGGTLVAQGAFSLYRRDILREIGGWPSCVGEDIVVTWAILRRGWFVGYAQDAVCFTRVPETLAALVRQRSRWARGMIEAVGIHPGILLRRRLTTFVVGWNLLFTWNDFAFTFGFIPGLFLALFGHFWLVGPVTLALLPTAALVGAVMYRSSARVFSAQKLNVARDLPGLVAYTLGYSLIVQPASLRGYVAELLGLRKSWGTK